MAELKPCPFCGGEARFGESPVYGTIRVTCTNSKCSPMPRTLYYTSEKEAAKAWNTRHAETCMRFWTGAELICSVCAHQLNDATVNYCPNCGRKVQQ